MKFTKLALASVAAFGLAGAASADPTYYVEESLEGWINSAVGPYTGANTLGNEEDGGAVWFTKETTNDATDPKAVITHYYDESLYPESAAKPAGANKFPTKNGEATGVGDFYLKVSNSSPLWRMLVPYGKVGEEGSETWPTEFPEEENTDVEVGEGLFVDTLVQFTPSEDPPTPEAGSKLIVWMNTNGVLCVTAGLISYDGESSPVTVSNHFVTGKSLLTNTWYRLTVSAYQDVDSSADTEFILNGFTVRIDGSLVASTTAVADEGFLASDFADGAYLNSEVASLIEANQFFGSLVYNQAATLAAVGFKGEGLVDDLLVSDVDPFANGEPAGGIDFTLTWDTDVSAVWYSLDGGETTRTPQNGVAVTLDSAEAGDTIIFGGTAADAWSFVAETTNTLSATGSENVWTVTATAANNAAAAGVKDAHFATWTPAQMKAAFNDEVTPAQVNADANAYYEYQFGLGLNSLSAEPALEIIGIAESETAGSWDVKVQVKAGETALSIDDGSDSKLNAALKVIAAETIAGFANSATTNAYAITCDATATDLTVTVPAQDGQFFKAFIEYVGAPTVQNQEPEQSGGNE